MHFISQMKNSMMQCANIAIHHNESNHRYHNKLPELIFPAPVSMKHPRLSTIACCLKIFLPNCMPSMINRISIATGVLYATELITKTKTVQSQKVWNGLLLRVYFEFLICHGDHPLHGEEKRFRLVLLADYSNILDIVHTTVVHQCFHSHSHVICPS